MLNENQLALVEAIETEAEARGECAPPSQVDSSVALTAARDANDDLLAQVEKMREHVEIVEESRSDLIVELDRAEQKIKKLTGERDDGLRMVLALTGTGPCGFDHHGNCQEHGWLDGHCPKVRAEALLAGAIREDTDAHR